MNKGYIIFLTNVLMRSRSGLNIGYIIRKESMKHHMDIGTKRPAAQYQNTVSTGADA